MRKTALTLTSREAQGGSYWDSLAYFRMFKYYKPHNFGVKTSQLFSSKLGEHLINKKFTHYTIASNNCYNLPGGISDYEWHVSGNSDVDFRFTELLLQPGTQAGKGNLEFKFALDRPWLHEPVVIKTEGRNLPLINILGHSIQRSANSWEYTGKLQTSDPTVWIPTDYLTPGRTAIDVTTSVSDELNTKYGGDQYGEMFKLQSHIGYYARKIEFTDKMVRAELSARKMGKSMPSNYSDNTSVGIGYVYQEKLKNQNTQQEIQKDVFITMAEARLLERIEYDREMMMEFGSLEKWYDPESDRMIKVAPGWRQLVRDGHYMEHNGSLTLSDIYEYLMNIFITRRSFSDRRIMICSGEAGIEFLHRLLAQEAGAFLTLDTKFIESIDSPYHSNALSFGAQFTQWKAPNGMIVELVHDPMKDDRRLFPELAPGTNRTVESFCYDIMDFGATDQKAAGASPENITMVKEKDAEYYFTVSNAFNFDTGAIQDGSNAYSNNKELGIYREINGSLCVWDTSRIGRIELNPNHGYCRGCGTSGYGGGYGSYTGGNIGTNPVISGNSSIKGGDTK